MGRAEVPELSASDIAACTVERVRKTLEVIVCSVEDAVEAERGGADRLEIVRNLEVGGLTPPVALVKEILQKVSIPVRVMVRENAGFTVTGSTELAKLQDDAKAFGQLTIDGLVVGFAADSQLDLTLTQSILSCAPHCRATFHRAFEEAADQAGAIAELKKLSQIDRILTSGGAEAGWLERTRTLQTLERLARPELIILAGGDLCQGLLEELNDATELTEFHVGRAAREPAEYHGIVRHERVAELRRILDQKDSDDE